MRLYQSAPGISRFGDAGVYGYAFSDGAETSLPGRYSKKSTRSGHSNLLFAAPPPRRLFLAQLLIRLRGRLRVFVILGPLFELHGLFAEGAGHLADVGADAAAAAADVVHAQVGGFLGEIAQLVARELRRIELVR